MLTFGDLSASEMAELDFSISYFKNSKRPAQVTYEGGKFEWLWRKVDERAARRMDVYKRPQLTNKERHRLQLLKSYRGQSVQFWWVHRRFLGQNRHKSVAPWYQEIFETLRDAEVSAWRREQSRRRYQPVRRIVYPANRYTILSTEEDSVVFDDIEDEDVCDYDSPIRIRTVRVKEDWSNVLIGPVAPVEAAIERDESLLDRLWFAIHMLRLRRSSQHIRNLRSDVLYKLAERLQLSPTSSSDEECEESEDEGYNDRLMEQSDNYIEFQMEGQQGESLQTEKSGNVILSEENPASQTLAARPVQVSLWDDMCSSEVSTSYTYLTERWFLVKSATWKGSLGIGKEFVDLKFKLPLDVRNIGRKGEAPLRAPFDIFSYYKSDIELKIHVNSNKFQLGQLQFSFQYMEQYRESNSFDNMYLRSQLPNVVINAGASNEATLYIPYKNVVPYMTTKYGDIGILRCFVIVPLDAGDSCPKECGVTIFVRFPNCKFMGMIDGGAPEMEAAATAMVAGSIIDKVIGDRNCDNPTDGSPPNYIVPTASHSWSISSGLVQPLHNLRLMGPNVSVGRPVGIDMSESSIGIPCRTFGMLQPFMWTSSDNAKNKYGYELFRCDAHPQLDKSKFYKEVIENGLDKYSVPPITVVSGLYSQWRGSIEFKFDVVCSQFHTGRLLVAYIPNRRGKAKITLDMARNSPCAEFSLQDSGTFTFTVPYISSMPWYPRKYAGPLDESGNQAPSMLIMFVLNPLIVMDSVPKYVYIVPYVRGGVDFEVSVPCQPSISLGCHPMSTLDKKDQVYPTAGSYPYRCTNYQGFYEGKKYIMYEGTAAFGTAATFHASETPIKRDEKGNLLEWYYCKCENSTAMPSCKFTVWDGKAYVTKLEYASFLVLWYVDGKGYYGIPFPAGNYGESMAKKVAAGLLLGKDLETLKPFLFDYIEDSTNSSGDFNKLFYKPQIVTKADAQVLWPSSDYVIVEPQMEERYSVQNVLNPVGMLPSTSCGMYNFNENFSDMKDLCRRYQLYLDHNIKLTPNFMSGEALAVIPVIPSGLNLDIQNPRSVFNLIRDGHIPMVLNGYVFFRGSIRFRLIVSSDEDCFDGMSVWIQHHPDDAPGNKDSPTYFPNLAIDDKLKCHGYGFYIQNLQINRMIEFEVPFYQNGMYGILNKIDSVGYSHPPGYYCTLGNIVIGFTMACLSVNKTINIQMYYSIGDDFSMSTFRGFDKVCFTDEVWKPDTERIEQIQPKILPEMEDAVPEMFAALSTGIMSSVGSAVGSLGLKAVTTPMVSNVKRDIGDAIAESICNRISPDVKHMIKINQELKKAFEDETRKLATDSLTTSVFIQFIHVAANPTIKTLAISFASVLITMLKLGMDSLSSYVAVCSRFFNRCWDRFSTLPIVDRIVADVASPESDFELDDSVRSLIALIFGGVCVLFGCKAYAPPKGSADFLKGVSSSCSLVNNLIALLRNCSSLINRLVNYAYGKLYPEAKLYSLLDNDCPEIDAWLKEVHYLVDARNKGRYLYDRSMMSRVFDAATLGALIVSNGLDERKPGGKIIWDMYKEIRKLRNELCERGAHPDVRFETFPIFISGPPGIGKSFMATETSNRLLRKINFQQPGSLIYYIPAGAKYWNGCQNPAVLISDDMFQVSGTRLEEEIAGVFMVCSSSVLNPPMAAVEDKERRLNPLLYIMFCNENFPNFGTTARTPQAIYRRRKFLIEVELTDEMREKYPEFVDSSQLTPDERKNFNHLQFRYAFNPADVNTTYSEWMSYEDLFLIVGDAFVSHYMHERANFKNRMCNMYSLDPYFNEGNLITAMPELGEMASLKDQMNLIKDKINRNIDIINDPDRDDPTVWGYIRKFIDRVQKLKNEYQMPASVTSSEFERHLFTLPGDAASISSQSVDIDECLNRGSFLSKNKASSVAYGQPIASKVDLASEGGHRGFMANGIYLPTPQNLGNGANVMKRMEEAFKEARVQHQSDIEIYFNKYVEKYPDFHAAYQNALQRLSDMSNTQRYVDILKKYPHSEMLGADLLIHEGVQDLLDQVFMNNFSHAHMDDTDCPQYTNLVFQETMNKFNPSYFEKIQFLLHKFDNFNLLIGYLMTGEGGRELCKSRNGCWPRDTQQQWERDTQGNLYSRPVYFKENKGIAARQLEYREYRTIHRAFLDYPSKLERERETEMWKAFGRYLHIRFPSLPARIHGHFLNLTSFDKLLTIMANLCDRGVFRASAEECVKQQEPMIVDGEYAFVCIMSMALMFRSLFETHDCGRRVSFISRPSYCNVRNKLTDINGERIDLCDYKGCYYSSELVYLLGCMCAKSHVRFQNLADKPSKFYDPEEESVNLNLPDRGDCGEFISPFDSLINQRRQQSIDKERSDFKSYWEEFFYHRLPRGIFLLIEFIAKILPYIITLITAGWAAYKMYNFFFSGDDNPEFDTDEPEPEANYFKFNQPKFSKKASKPKPASKTFVKPEMSLDQRSAMAARISRNSVMLYVSWIQDGERLIRNCRCLMLCGRAMLVLRHYLEEYSYLVAQGYRLKIDFVSGDKHGSPIKQNLEIDDLLKKVAWCEGSNYGIVELPAHIHMFKNITPFFATAKSHENVSGKVDIYTIAGESSYDLPLSVKTSVCVGATETTSEIVMERAYSYVKQRKGLCGSIVVSPSLGNGNGAIIGMHVAGNGNTGIGYAEPLLREMFDEYFQAMPVRQVMETPLLPLSEAKVELDGNLALYGCVPKEFSHTESGKSIILPSKIHGQIYPVRTQINPLRPNDPRQPPGSDPLRDGCNKHGSGIVTNFPQRLVEDVKEDIKDRLRQIVRPVRAQVRPLEMQQAVCGDVDVPYFEALNWKSSEGFPLSSMRPKTAHDKKWLFDLSEGQFGYKLNKLHVKLEQQLKLRDLCYEKNLKPPTVYVDCLKDYRLKPEKCAQPGSTRIFSIAPIQCTLDIRIHLNDFCAAIKNTHIVNSIGIGINPDSLEWTDLVSYLFEVGDKIITLDYKNFGPCLMSQLVAASNDCIVDWFEYNKASPNHVKRVEWLLDCDILNPVHLCNNVVYQTVNGIASGSPLTGECNSIPNLMYIRLAYLEIMSEYPELCNMYYFNLFVRLVVYGDDLIMSVSDEIISIFNACSIRDKLFEHGIIVTSAQKTKELEPYGSIYEATFLKRSFVHHPFRAGIWLAPVEVASVEEAVNWVHKNDDEDAALLEVCNASLDLAFGHGPEYYNAHRLRLVEAVNNLGLVLNSKPWAVRDREIFDEDSNKEIKSFKINDPWHHKLHLLEL